MKEELGYKFVMAPDGKIEIIAVGPSKFLVDSWDDVAALGVQLVELGNKLQAVPKQVKKKLDCN